MYRLVFVSSLLILFMGLGISLQAGQAGLAPDLANGVKSSVESVPRSETPSSKAKWKKRLGQKWRNFKTSNAAKYFRAFLLFAAIGTALYLLGVFIAAGTVLTSVIASAALAELISGGLYIGAYICYLYAFYAGIAAIVTAVFSSADLT